MPARDVPPPLLLLQARGPLSWVRAVHVLIGLGGVAIAGVYLLGPLLHVNRKLGLASDKLLLLTGCGLVSAVVLAAWVFRRRAGCAELFADRVVVHRMSGDAVVAFFADLDAFDDLSADFVRLRRAATDDAARIDVPVPTPDEQARVTVMAALDAAGVPRDDGSTQARKAAPDGASVVVEAEVAAQLGKRRPGRVVFDARGVRLVHDPKLLIDRLDLALSWDDVVAWRVVRSDVLRLVLRVGLLRRHVGEPIMFVTSPERRRAIEAALTERGVPRLGADEAAP